MYYFVQDFRKCLLPIVIFLILFIIDFIFGLCKGIYIEGVSSAKLRMSVPKFIGYVGMIFMCLLLDTLIISSTDFDYSPIGLISIVAFCLIEISSILENARTLGIDIPPIISSTVKAIKDKFFTLEDKPEQKGGGSGMKWAEWVKKYLGKKTDWDGVYGVQCVDLVDCYIDKCLGLKVGFFGNAKNWWLDRNKSAWLKQNFDFITPTYKNGELQVGDIGIRTSGTYGHIFIVAEQTVTGRLRYYDQNNGGTGAGMTLRTVPYTSQYITGVLRPKDQMNLKEANIVSSKYGNAQMTSAQITYADSDLTVKVGSVSKGERVYHLGTGEGNPIITYKTSTGYKVGFVKAGSVKKD